MKAKPFLMIFVGMAVVPLLLAFLVLKLGWFNAGATAKGEFLEQEVQLTLTTQDKPKWHIVYQPQPICEKLCDEQLYGLNQTYIALGKLQKRVNALVLSKQMDISQYTHLQINPEMNSELSADYLYVVDPMGKVILRYKGSEQRDETIVTSKKLLADLKKLLNYARMG